MDESRKLDESARKPRGAKLATKAAFIFVAAISTFWASRFYSQATDLTKMYKVDLECMPSNQGSLLAESNITGRQNVDMENLARHEGESQQTIEALQAKVAELETKLELQAKIAQLETKLEEQQQESQQTVQRLQEDNTLPPTIVPSNKLQARHGNVLITLISMGENTRTYLVERFLHSLRTRGEWDGHVMVLTDAPEYYQDLIHPTQTTQSGLNLTHNLHIVDVDKEDQQWDFKWHHHMKYKRFKMLQFKYADRLFPLGGKGGTGKNRNLNTPTDIDSILYIDQDIMVGQPLDDALGYFIRQRDRTLEGLKNKQKSFMWMFQEDGKESEPFHTGAMFLDRRRSVKCLDLWRKVLEGAKKGEGRDQILIGKMLKAHPQECAVHGYPSMEPFFSFPDEVSMNMGQASIFIHLTKLRALRVDNTVQEKWISKLYPGMDPLVVKIFGEKPKINVTNLESIEKDAPSNSSATLKH